MICPDCEWTADHVHHAPRVCARCGDVEPAGSDWVTELRTLRIFCDTCWRHRNAS